MEIITIPNEGKIAHFPSAKSTNMIKVLKYLEETKDTEFIQDSPIIRIEFMAKFYVKIYLPGEVWGMLPNDIEWLKSHHYIASAINMKEQLEKLWDMIHDKVDLFVIEEHLLIQWDRDEDLTYDRQFIYVKGKNTFIPFNKVNYVFVKHNKTKWF